MMWYEVVWRGGWIRFSDRIPFGRGRKVGRGADDDAAMRFAELSAEFWPIDYSRF